MTYRFVRFSFIQFGLIIFLFFSFEILSAQTQSFADSFSKLEVLMNQDLNQALDYSIRLEEELSFGAYLGFKEELMLNQAEIYSGLGNFNQEDSLLKRVSNLNVKNISPEQSVHLLVLKAIALKCEEKYSDAVLQMNKAELIYAELDSEIPHNEIYTQYAQIYLLLGNRAKALSFINAALEEEKEFEGKQKFDLLIDKALIYGQLENFKEQYNALEQLSSLYKKDSLHPFLGKLGLAWADYYLIDQNYELALPFLNEAEIDFRKKNDIRNLYAVYMKKAGVYGLKSNSFAHKLFLQQAIDMAESLGDVSLVFGGKLELAKVFFNQQENDSAFLYAKSVIQESPFLRQKIIAYDVLKSIYLAQNNFKDGLSTLEKRQALSDSLNAFELDKALVLNKIDFDESKYNEEKIEIENQIEVHQLERENHLLVIRLVGGSLVLSMVLGFALYFFFKYKNERRNSLRSQKLIYLQLNAHFVFNSLTAIQSLILKNKVVNAEHYLQMFADLMQSIIKSSTHSKVPLHEELSFHMAYLQLQKLRFGDDLNYKILINEDINPQQYNVPPFLIYPYLEYAIEYCIQKSGARGIIGIQLMLEDKYLVIELEDNGLGFLDHETAFLKRPNQKAVSLLELTKERVRELNSWPNKKYQMQVMHSKVEGKQDKNILQFKMRID